ncbi:unnamed protein product [Arctia plantaginis]|uniref:Uncharacterized protein n=1 Tax=Arctia plantaginis TaxID=874455 RepID=A0A8S1AG00_ARCPL|nr:unnamed protein product [Arctia plantaginis]CAB3252135.1 unnamed protein product [Arctia plantaginis]
MRGDNRLGLRSGGQRASAARSANAERVSGPHATHHSPLLTASERAAAAARPPLQAHAYEMSPTYISR